MAFKAFKVPVHVHKVLLFSIISWYYAIPLSFVNASEYYEELLTLKSKSGPVRIMTMRKGDSSDIAL